MLHQIDITRGPDLKNKIYGNDWSQEDVNQRYKTGYDIRLLGISSNNLKQLTIN